jgi:hypothetical protein
LWPAVLATALALTLLNLALASWITRLLGAPGLPAAATWLVLAAGLALGALAVLLWRRFWRAAGRGSKIRGP